MTPQDGRFTPRARSRRRCEVLSLDDALVEAQDVDTIGGYVLKLQKRQPRVGDEVTVGDWRVVVEAAQGFRILRLHCTPWVDTENAPG